MNSILRQNSFLKVSLITVLLIISQTLLGRNFYFSNSTGDDSRTSAQAQNQATPWKSISKLNSFFASLAAGDSILFKRGEVFYGSIRIGKSGTSTLPIVLSSYGQGSNPIISGFQTVTGWTNKGNNIWESASINCKPTLNMVTVNNVNTPMGRYPNTGTANGGYLTYETFSGSTYITDNQLTSSPNWIGAEVVVRKNAWVINRCPITNHVNGTLTFTDASGYGGYNGWGYFIQNDIRTLDVNGEWFLNKTTKKISMYFSGNNPNSYNVKASTLDTLVYSSGNRYINFVNLNFEGGNEYGFYINAGDHFNIRQCNLDFMGKDAIYYPNHAYITVYGCNISNINDNVISGSSNSPNSYIGYCNIKNAYLIPGNAGVGDGHGFGVSLRADNSIAEYNTVKNVGYIAIAVSSNNSTINNNYVDSACLIKDDGAAIYISGASTAIMAGRIIKNNIVKNSLGNANGKSSIFTAKANGIYADGHANNVTIEGNTVVNSSAGGIYTGFYAHDIKIINNTLYNNLDNLRIIENDLVNNNCVFNGNILAANGSTNLFSAINGSETKIYRPIETFGTWSGNYYIKPFDDKNVLSIRYNVSTKTILDGVTLNGWRNYDPLMKGSPISIPQYKVNSLIGSNKFTDGTFTSNIAGLRSGYFGTCALNWDNTNKINGGSARLTYTAPLSTTNDKATLSFNVGAVTAGKSYILKFDLLGSKPDKAVMVYICKSVSPYTPLTPKDKYFPYTTVSTTNEILIEPSSSDPSVNVCLAFRDEDGTIYLDNVSFYEADVTKTNEDEMMRLEYNPTNSAKIISLPASFVDVKGTPYSNSITLQPYTSTLLFKTGNIVNLPPVILNQSFQINENSTNGTQVGKVSASDPNVGQTLSYSILSGNTNGTFSINSTSGIITVANSTGFNFEALPSYSLVIRVQDNGTGSLTSQATITITLINVNENPVINDQSFSILSNAANGTVVGTVIATDPDADQTKTFSILSGNTNNAFSINSTTGILTVSNSASLNILTTPTYSLIVKVMDNGVGNLSSQATINVNLTNSNSCSATGNITYQVWNNIGNTVTISTLTSNINYPGNPTASTFLNSFEAPINQTNEYGARIVGYICAPSTGNYTFWIASDDNGELWLSTNDQVGNKIKIAYHNAYTASREWNKYATQKSISINLIQGKKYYIEALMKDGSAGDNLAVGWLKPGQTGSVPSEVIPGSVLSPIETNQAVLVTSVTLTSTMTINTDSEAMILASVFPSNATNGTLVWGTSNATIATVNNSGLVTGIAPGNVTITATSTDGSNKSGTCSVTVYEPACSAAGTITYQVWNNLGGTVTISTLTSNINYPDNPTTSSLINSLEAPINQANEYGARITGYICAPLTGSYTFWIASDDNGELWLSTDDQATNKIRIAYHNAYTSYREWNKYTNQKSVSINLIQGKKYYIEALMKDGSAGDNLSVGWLKPGQTGSVPSEIIPGSVLSPIAAPSQTVKSPDCSAVGTITYDIWNDIGSGLSISDLTTNTNYPNNPSSSSLISSMEGTANQANNYGARIAGYVCAPSTGNYTFWISSDDFGELWLSSDDQPANKEKIAYHNGYTGVRIWNKYLTQKSVEIYLIKGHKYYIEALMTEATGYDNLAVGWLKPGQIGSEPSEVIPGSVLSPLGLKSKVAEISSIGSNNNEISESDVNLLVYPNPISSGVLNVKIENLANTATLRIYSVSGTLCFEKVVEETGVIQIDRSLLSSGVYVLKVFNNAFIKSIKLVVR